jgi:hypothetical protein
MDGRTGRASSGRTRLPRKTWTRCGLLLGVLLTLGGLGVETPCEQLGWTAVAWAQEDPVERVSDDSLADSVGTRARGDSSGAVAPSLADLERARAERMLAGGGDARKVGGPLGWALDEDGRLSMFGLLVAALAAIAILYFVIQRLMDLWYRGKIRFGRFGRHPGAPDPRDARPAGVTESGDVGDAGETQGIERARRLDELEREAERAKRLETKVQRLEDQLAGQTGDITLWRQRAEEQRSEADQLSGTVARLGDEKKAAEIEIEKREGAIRELEGALEAAKEDAKTLGCRLDYVVHDALPAFGAEMGLRLAGMHLVQQRDDPRAMILGRLARIMSELRRMEKCVDWDALGRTLQSTAGEEKLSRLLEALGQLSRIADAADGKLNQMLRIEMVSDADVLPLSKTQRQYEDWMRGGRLRVLSAAVEAAVAAIVRKKDEADVGALETLDEMLKKYLLFQAFSDFFVGRMVARRAAPPGSVPELDKVDAAIRGFLLEHYGLVPQEISLNKPFSDVEYHCGSTLRPSDRPGIGVGNIAAVNSWGYVHSDSNKICSKADVTVVDDRGL